MTNDDRDTLIREINARTIDIVDRLGRIEVQYQTCQTSLVLHAAALDGTNGEPGIKTRLGIVEERVEEHIEDFKGFKEGHERSLKSLWQEVAWFRRGLLTGLIALVGALLLFFGERYIHLPQGPQTVNEVHGEQGR